MSTFRILPDGNQFQILETNGEAGTLTIRHFETSANARQWMRGGTPMAGTVICWRDRVPLARERAA